MTEASRDDVFRAWQQHDSGLRYAERRFATARAAGRDPRRVLRLLAPLRVDLQDLWALDVPCGTGRLRPALESFGLRWTGTDLSPSMLAQLSPGSHLCADALRLPFADRSFELVLCCRLLHHLKDAHLLARVLGELTRVSNRFVAASFWDANSFPAWRERHRRRPRARIETRRAHSRAAMRAAVEAAGGRIRRFDSGMRFIGRQTFFLAERWTATEGR